MLQLGLALSGGGFRATLYHLGVVRYLHDANLLNQVTHITSVSGGSVLAAHLVLNWDRYTGSSEEFDAAAQEVLDFIRLDVRNRIIRRYPFALGCGFAQQVAQRRPWRGFTRTGLLEQHYQRYLYGDTCLFQLPVKPELHILSTNLSEGGLSSFCREGLLVEERGKSLGITARQHRAGLATVPMAVAASSAFPGFFPPLELTASDIGAVEGDFQTLFFTDGGVYDNLGIRMFRFLEQRQKSTLSASDFDDLETAIRTWNHARQSSESSPLQRLARMHAAPSYHESGDGSAQTLVQEPQELLDDLQRLLYSPQLSDDPKLQSLVPQGLAVRHSRGNGNGSGHDEGDHDGNGLEDAYGHARDDQSDRLGFQDNVARNRRILCRAFQAAAGKACLRLKPRGFDAVIASDAGKKFQVARPDRASGFLRTALRSSDILMDRVWQLEKEHFADSTGYVFAPITRVVTPEEDPTALHHEVQVQVSHIRTDMDRFSNREISGLIRHGYCVARQVTARRACLTKSMREGTPWDPIARSKGLESGEANPRIGRRHRTHPAARDARKLQRSSRRHYWGLVKAPRDWVLYIYLPILFVLLGVLPTMAYRLYRHVHVNGMLTSAIAETRHDYRKLLDLMENGPVEPWTPLEYVDADRLDPLLAEQGLDIISDTRITDLRDWLPSPGVSVTSEQRHVYFYRLVSIRKTAHAEGVAGLRMQTLMDRADFALRCLNSELSPLLRRCEIAPADDGRPRYAWDIELDFSDIPIGHTVEVIVEAYLPYDASQVSDERREWWRFEVDANPEVATAWVLLPESMRHVHSRVVRYENTNPDTLEMVEPTHRAVIRDGSILNWTVVHPKAGHTYTCRWSSDN